MRGDQVLIPSALRQQLLVHVHEGHVGTKKMRSVLQVYAFWPGYSRDIVAFVKRCSACTVYQIKLDASPLVPIAEKADTPYEVVSVDLIGPSAMLHGQVLLTMIVYYSHYPEVFILKRGDTKEILTCLRHVFARNGIPATLVDNGSVFRSVEFEEFLCSIGTKHVLVSNYHPMSNGMVERMHGTLKNRISKICFENKLSLATAVDMVMFDIRSSPHAVMDVSLFSHFFGMKLTALKGVPAHAVCISQDMEKKYSAVPGHCVTYRVNDLVYFRKGKGPFIHKGRIVADLGNHAYKLEIDNGYQRIYNQCELKHHFSAPEDDERLSLAREAYEQACSETTLSIVSTQSTPSGSKIHVASNRYPLRRNYIDPKK